MWHKVKQWPIKNGSLYLVGLTSIFLVAALVNHWYAVVDKTPPWWDYAGYLSSSIRLYNGVKQGSLPAFLAVFYDPYRPPLVPLLALPFYFVFGTAYPVAMMVNIVLIGILCLSLYKLGGLLFSSALGLVVAGIVISLPGLVDNARVFGLDFPITALTPCALWLLLASKGFQKRAASVALGLVIGLGMLAKWSYFVFVIPAIAVEAFRNRRTIDYANAILSGLICAVVISAWYLNAIGHGLGQVFAAVPLITAEGDSSSTLLFYPLAIYYLIGRFYSPVLLGLMGMSMILGHAIIRSGQHARPGSHWSLILSFLTPFLFFSLLANKQSRFLLPAIPTLILLVCLYVWRRPVGSPRFGRSMLVLALLIGLVVSASGILSTSVACQFGICPIASWSDEYSLVSEDNDWKLKEIVQMIHSANPKAKTGILASHVVFNQDTMTYYALLLGFSDLEFRDFRDSQVYPPYDNLTRYDMVILKSGNVGYETVRLQKVLEGLRDPSNWFYSNYHKLASYNLPDGSYADLYCRTSNNSAAMLDGRSIGLSWALAEGITGGLDGHCRECNK